MEADLCHRWRMAGGGMRIVEAVMGNGVAAPVMVSLSAGTDCLVLLAGMEDGILPMMIYLSVK